MEIKIYYEDTDCGGVVYYANYLKYFERARTDYLEERGISVVDLLRDGTQFMVVRAQVNYRSPAHFGETLTIDTRIGARGKAALEFTHAIRDRDSRRMIVEGSATLVAVGADRKIKRLPRRLIDMPIATPRRAGRTDKPIKKARH